jgi:hypothetical protein
LQIDQKFTKFQKVACHCCYYAFTLTAVDSKIRREAKEEKFEEKNLPKFFIQICSEKMIGQLEVLSLQNVTLYIMNVLLQNGMSWFLKQFRALKNKAIQNGSLWIFNSRLSCITY